MQTTPQIESTTLSVWHASFSLDKITEMIGIEPDKWYLDGQSYGENNPVAVGNTWQVISRTNTPLADITAKVRSQKERFEYLTTTGATIAILCQYFPGHDAGIPAIDLADSQLIANMKINLGFHPIKQAP